MSKSEDRGMMKWNAFYSVLSEDEINKSIDSNDITEMPELSEDQIEDLERDIISVYNSKSEVNIYVFEDGSITVRNGVITKLDPLNKAIFLDKKMIPFSKITKIEIIEQY